MTSAVGTVLTNGRVLTMDPRRPEAEAVAIRTGRIVQVGSDAEAVAAAGPGAPVVDLGGGSLLPGFQDAHVHPLDGGLGLELCDLSAVHALDGYLAAVQGWAAAHPEADWVRGGGWYRDAFPGNTPTGASSTGSSLSGRPTSTVTTVTRPG
ncbi:amidohydrolase family protein [Nocardioides guangzhouensis]|uniref:amidohydrolase family protein n=1 Tax=Nocardioides guangzhouensis TaxID=2497878 RepID=UPI001C377C16|nr:amidohydrolase family protein [Nocardioides guangzhouensis]